MLVAISQKSENDVVIFFQVSRNATGMKCAYGEKVSYNDTMEQLLKIGNFFPPVAGIFEVKPMLLLVLPPVGSPNGLVTMYKPPHILLSELKRSHMVIRG